jgi:anti-sigma B factor antagonist
MSDTLAVSIKPHAEVVWATVQRRELDDAALNQLQNDISTAAAQQPKLPVVLDLSQVSFIPSMGLGALVMLMRNLKKNNQRLLLVGVQSEIRKVFAITRLDKLFEMHTNFEAALSHLRGMSQVN